MGVTSGEPVVLADGAGTVTQIPGETFVVKATGDATGNHLALAVGEWAPRHGTALHRHPSSSESFYILSGTFIIDIDDEEYHVSSGAFAFVPPGSSHRITNVGDEPGRLIGFFTPAGPEKGFQAVRQRAAELGRIPEMDEIRRIMTAHGTTNHGPARMRVEG